MGVSLLRLRANARALISAMTQIYLIDPPSPFDDLATWLRAGGLACSCVDAICNICNRRPVRPGDGERRETGRTGPRTIRQGLRTPRWCWRIRYLMR